MEELHMARYGGRGMERPSSKGVPVSQLLDVSSNAEALQISLFRVLMEI
jgi:hypothetical protein